MVGGRYALRTALGTGGMGTVWRATDTLLRRDVAVKEVVLPRRLAPNERDGLYQRTLREARACAALSHPSVVQVYDVVTDGGRPWIVMELLHSRSLAEIIVEDGPLAPRAVAKIGIALLGALEVAHAAGVLHRDVKPANVLICGDGRCVLTDFGVALMPTEQQLTTPGMVLGSPHFISPERAIGGKFGPPSDLFSLGVTLYTAVEGRPPFDKPDPFETMRAVVEEPPARMERADALTDVLYGLLEKDPARRWDVRAARDVLRDLLGGPLASRAPDHLTDPHAVVRPAPYTPPPVPAQPNGQIGGRAMLAPGESVTGAVRRRQGGTAPAQRSAADGDHSAGYAHATPPKPAYRPPGAPGKRPRHSAHRAPVPSQRGAALIASTGAGVREASGRAVQTVRRLPRAARLGIAAGVALLVVGVALVASLGGASDATTPTDASSAGRPLIEVQQYRDTAHPLVVNVPAGWQRQAKATSVDYVDPRDAGRWVRVTVEPASGQTGRAVLQVAATRFGSVAGGCPGLQQIAWSDGKLGGYDSAIMEFSCSPSGGAQRHGLWQLAVVDGLAYGITLSVPASRFDESVVIFNEMVRSLRIG